MPSSSAGDGGKRKREPGKRCVIYCNNTNDNGVSLHQFPTDEKIRQKWIDFVVRKRDPKSWTPGTGHICSDHFEKNDFENYAKISGLCSKLLLRKEAVPSNQPTPDTSTDSLQQQPETDFRKKKCRSTSPKTATTQSSRGKSDTLTKLRAHRVSISSDSSLVMVVWFVCNFQRNNFGLSCYSNTILIQLFVTHSRYKQQWLSMKTLDLRGSSKRTRAQMAARQYILSRKYRMFARKLLRRVIRDLQGEVKVISLQCLILNSCARQDE